MDCAISVPTVGGFYWLLVICVNVFFSAFSVTWRKNNVEIRSDAFHVVKAEGERHSLAIKQMRLNNAGSYCVTAVNTAGRASCSAMLYIQSGESRPEMEGSQHAKGFAFRFVTVTHLKVYNTNLNEDRDVEPHENYALLEIHEHVDSHTNLL